MKSIALLAFALAVLPQARADSHWTTNGVHKGVLTLSAEPGAVTALDAPDVPGGHNYLGEFTLTYSLSTILGEPVHDFNFSWDWHKSDLIVARRPGRTITTTDLGRHPALSRAFSSLKPISLTITTRINFYGTNGEHLGFGFKKVNPGLVEQAGTKEMLHLPGSPRWSDFFTCDFPDNPSRDELSRRNRELFQKAARVTLGDPKVTAIEWPEDALERIADEFLRLAPPASAPARAATETDAGPKLATSPNPFEEATRKNSGDQDAQENYTGRFRGQGIDLRLLAEASKWKGTLLFQARNYNVEAERKSSGLEGRFADGKQFWPFSVLHSSNKLIFTAGSFTTTLHRQTLPKLEGGWRSPRLLITFESAAPKPGGHIQFNGQEYSFVAEERAGDLEGVFKAGDKSFPFRIANETRGLVFNTAGYAELLNPVPNRSLLRVHTLPPSQFTLLNDGRPIQGQDGLYEFPGSPTLHLELLAKGYHPVRTNLTLPAYGEVSWTAPLERAFYPTLELARWTNSLDMVFVPIPGTKTLFCAWDTRVQDYAAYAATASDIDPAWRNVEFQGVPVSSAPNHPVTMVSWDDARKFCRWLTLNEQQARLISAEQFYRLPTDAEWSKAVGLKNENEGMPASKNERVKGVYPWGTSWPPPNGFGNFADRAAKDSFKDLRVIRNYDDGFPTTSPVGRFPANRFGLYDMTGNVWQWCEDWYDKNQTNHVVRGASWQSVEPRALLSSHRSGVPEGRGSSTGFRCVLVTGEP